LRGILRYAGVRRIHAHSGESAVDTAPLLGMIGNGIAAKGLKGYGGETGIRTLDTLRYTRFPSVRLQPLGHLSALTTTYVNISPKTSRLGGPRNESLH
jgi:hypothetical protein